MSDYQGLVTKWRKVQDEMPEYDTDLLLWSEAWGHIYVGYWRHSEEWIGRHRPESDESLPDTNPTHWTYFPAPPETEVIARNVQPSPDADSEPAPGSFKCPCCACPWRQCVHDDCSECGGKRLNAEARPVQQPATEPDENIEKLVAQYADENPYCCPSHRATVRAHTRILIRAAIKEALALRDVPQGQWIDVKERLPEENERVLIWMYEGRLDGFRERFGEICLGHWRPEGGNGNFDSQVSYWQPLPAAPVAARQVPVGPEGKK